MSWALLRFVLVTGVTFDRQEIVSIARFITELGNVERLDVPPFHQMGRCRSQASVLTAKQETIACTANRPPRN